MKVQNEFKRVVVESLKLCAANILLVIEFELKDKVKLNKLATH